MNNRSRARSVIKTLQKHHRKVSSSSSVHAAGVRQATQRNQFILART